MKNSHNINSSQLELLVALTERGSFSEAAQMLGLTQSAVSHGLARLETELGLVLIERGRRGVTLTGAGREILPHAREVVARLDTIRQIAQMAGDEAGGKVRVGVAHPFPSLLLAGVVGAFRTRFPHVELVVVDDAGDGKNLSDGVIDVSAGLHPALGGESRLLLTDELQAVVPRAHSFAARERVNWHSVFNEPLIVPRLGGEQVREAARGQETTPGRPQVRHIMSDLPTMLAMTRAGLGVALISGATFAGQAEQWSDLVAVPLSPPLTVTYGLAVRSWDAASPVAKRFVEAAEEWARTQG